MNLDNYLKDERLSLCQKTIGYQFNNPHLLLEALWHSSQKNLTGFNYDRLEFLGDAILKFIVSQKLFELYPQYQEGSLTKASSNIVSAKSLSQLGKKLGLDQFIFIATQSQNQISDSIISDVYESIIAAIYLDGGMNEAKKFIDETIADLLISPLESTINYKAILMEYAQKNKIPLPKYEVIEQLGPDHDCQFQMILLFNNITYGPLIDRSKKDAEQKLAQVGIKASQIPI